MNTSIPRPSEHLVVGLDGPKALVSGRVAVFLLTYPERLADYHREHRGDDPEIDQGVEALKRVALHWRSSRCGTTQPPTPLLGASSTRGLSTAQAARRLGMTPRGVRKAIDGGRLPAELMGHRAMCSTQQTSSATAPGVTRHSG